MHYRVLTTVLVVLGLVAVVAVAADDDPPPTALLVIDVQHFYFGTEEGTLPLVGPEAAGGQAGRLVAGFRELGWPVIHIQHLPKGQDAPDPMGPDPQYRIHASVFPVAGETPALHDELVRLAERLSGDPDPMGVQLTGRELDVLAQVALGCSNAEAAKRLSLKPETAKSYLRSAAAKLGAHSRMEAVSKARRAGLLP